MKIEQFFFLKLSLEFKPDPLSNFTAPHIITRIAMPANIPKLDLKSKSIPEEQKEKMRQLFPEVFTDDKIDWERLQLTLGADVETGKERFGLTWRGKAECFRIIQEPSIGTLKPVKGESVDWDTTQNLFIEGDNLETLKLPEILLRQGQNDLHRPAIQYGQRVCLSR